MSKLFANENYISNPKGRKYVWGNLRFIGQFTAIDFLIVAFSILFLLPFFWILNIIWVLILALIILFSSLFLITENRGVKGYELFFKIFTLFSKTKKFNPTELVSSEESGHIVYEVLSGWDITNLNTKDISFIENEMTNVLSNIKTGSIKICKFNSTFRMRDYTNALKNEIKSLNYKENEIDKNKALVLDSYLSNVEKFKNSTMPNIYIEFIDVDKVEIEIFVSKISSTLELKKVNEQEWNSIKISNFNHEDEKGNINNRNFHSGGNQYVIGKMDFQRNIPSFWMTDLIFNEKILFSVELRNPTFDEKEKIKKDIKKWSKQVMKSRDISSKNIIDAKKEIEGEEAKDELMKGYIFNNEDIKYCDGSILLKIDKDSNLDWKKQVEEISFILEKKSNIVWNRGINQQLEFIKDMFLRTNTRRLFPVNSSTIVFGFPFQNQAILDKGGAYIGTTDRFFPFVYNSLKEGTAGKHTSIIARTGGGKSVLMQMLLTSSEIKKDSVNYILDPKSSGFHEAITSKFGGEVIKMDDNAINPLKFNSKVTKENFEKTISNKAIELEEFFYILFAREAKHSKNADSISQLSDAVKKFFIKKEKEIIKGTEFTFLDLKKEFKEKVEFKALLSKLVDGTYSTFNKKDNLILKDNKSYVFDLLEIMNMDNEITKATLFLILNKIMDEIFNRQNKDSNLGLWIDEAGDFLKSNFLLNKLERLMVKSRSFKTMIVLATQNISDLVGDSNKKLASIMGNSEHMFIGQLQDGQKQTLNEMFKGAEIQTLTDAEKDHIGESDSIEQKGKFLWINGRKRKMIHVDYLNNYVIKGWIEESKELKGLE